MPAIISNRLRSNKMAFHPSRKDLTELGTSRKGKGKRRSSDCTASKHLMGSQWPSQVTYIYYGISLDIVHVWILQPQFFAPSLCSADNSCSHCVLQRKWAAQGHHKLSGPQVRWLSQEQYRKVSLHMGKKGWGRQPRRESTGVCVQHIYDSLCHLAFIIQESPTQTLTC